MTTVEAVPSRVVGVARYLLHNKGKEKRAVVEAMMSPSTLRNNGDDENSTSGEGMIRSVIRECKSMELCSEESDDLVLAPDVAAAFPKSYFEAETMRTQLQRLILNQDSEANSNFGRALAWFMEQEPLSFGLDKNRRIALTDALRAQTGDGQLQITNNSIIDNFTYWAVYLGFAWKMNMNRDRDNAIGERLIPDPTPFLTRHLPELLVVGEETTLLSFMEKLAQLCPIFQGGAWHDDLEQLGAVPAREAQLMAPALGFALKRLEERGSLALIDRADAESRTLRSGEYSRNISHLERLI